MNVFMRGNQSVPILIAKRQVTKEPKIIKKRRFVGFKQGFGTLVDKTIDLVLDCFWDVEQEVLDTGESTVVHYAIDVNDDPGAGSPELIVTKLHGKARPACGFYCEIISPFGDEEQEELPHAPVQEESNAKMVSPKKKRPGR